MEIPIDAFGSSAPEPQPATQAASSSSASADLLAGNEKQLCAILNIMVVVVFLKAVFLGIN